MEKYIAYQYRAYHDRNNSIAFMKTYYSGYCDLKCFGIGTLMEPAIENAKRFITKKELENELKKIGRKVSDYKIEKVSD